LERKAESGKRRARGEGRRAKGAKRTAEIGKRKAQGVGRGARGAATGDGVRSGGENLLSWLFMSCYNNPRRGTGSKR